MKKEFNAQINEWKYNTNYDNYYFERQQKTVAVKAFDASNGVELYLEFKYDGNTPSDYFRNLIRNQNFTLTIETNEYKARIKELEDTIKKLKSTMVSNLETIKEIV